MELGRLANSFNECQPLFTLVFYPNGLSWESVCVCVCVVTLEAFSWFHL